MPEKLVGGVKNDVLNARNDAAGEAAGYRE